MYLSILLPYKYISDKALKKRMISTKWWTVVPFVEKWNKTALQSGFRSMGLIYFLKWIIGTQELIELLSFSFNVWNILEVKHSICQKQKP